MMGDLLCHAATSKGFDPLLVDLVRAILQSMEKAPFPLILSLSDGHSHRANMWVHWTNPNTGQIQKGELSVYLKSDGKIEAAFYTKDFPLSLSWKGEGGVEDLSRGLIHHVTQSIAKITLRDDRALPFSLLTELWKLCCLGDKGLVGFHTEEDSAIVVFEGGAALRLTSKSDGILATQYPGGVELPVTFTPHEIVGLIERFCLENRS